MLTGPPDRAYTGATQRLGDLPQSYSLVERQQPPSIIYAQPEYHIDPMLAAVSCFVVLVLLLILVLARMPAPAAPPSGQYTGSFNETHVCVGWCPQAR